MPQIVCLFHEQIVHYLRCGLSKRFMWSLKKNMFSSRCVSESSSSSRVLLLSSNDQMSGASWGCEGVFLWCYGCVCMFVMWQEVVTSGRRVLSDDGSWRSRVWDESGRGVGGGRNKELCKRRERWEPLHNKQGSLPPPDSCSPNVGDIDPGGAVNDRVVWKASGASGAGEANLLIPQSPWISTVGELLKEMHHPHPFSLTHSQCR